MKFFKRSVFFVVLIGIVLAALYFIALRRDIDISLPCVIWNIDDPVEGELEGIEIKGVYHDYLIKGDRFRGTVRISEVNAHEQNTEMTLEFDYWLDMQEATLFYWSRVYNRTVFLGSIYMQGTFDKMLIFLTGDGQNALLDDKCISAPATNIEEAIAIAKDLHFA